MVGANYNITSLADAIGMTRGSLSARLNGKIDFSRFEMQSIAEKLNISPETLFF